jgi:hypothetical protein
VQIPAELFIGGTWRSSSDGSRLAERMGALRVGPGTEAGVELGPLVNAEAVRKVSALVDATIGAGARVLTGAHRPDGAGFYHPATVLADVPPGAAVLAEEIFGPVAPIALPSTPRRRRSGWPTTPSTAWFPMSTPATSRAACGWRRHWSPAWSA